MEKCTYCVQRIYQGKIQSELEDRRVRDGEIVTACQAACPTRALVFGDLNDETARGDAARSSSPRNYGMLAEELNTRPRTTYLAPRDQPESRDRDGVRRSRWRTTRTTARSGGSGETPIIGPGHTLRHGHRQDQLDRPDRGPQEGLAGRASRVSFALRACCFMVAVTYLFAKGVGDLGHQRPGDVGLRDRQLRLVDRHRPRRDADLGDPAAAAAGVADLDQPVRRGDDALRRRLRRHVPAPPPGPPLGLLLADAVPEHDGAVAPVAQPAGLGRLRGVDLRHGLAAVLVRRPDPRPGDAPRPGQEPARRRSIYGILSMGWRGSARHWARYQTAYLLLAGLATPLVVSVHTIVSYDFAVGIVPGWHTTIFPPYFVAGAIFSGFAMVLTLAIPLRVGLQAPGLHHRPPPRQHGQGHAGDRPDRRLRLPDGGLHRLVRRERVRDVHDARNRPFGPYCAVLLGPDRLQHHHPAVALVPVLSGGTWSSLWIISIIINVGMWLERFVIVVTSLSQRLRAGGLGACTTPTFWDWSTFIGTIGVFFTLMFLFVRFLPVISITEMRELVARGPAPRGRPAATAIGGDGTRQRLNRRGSERTKRWTPRTRNSTAYLAEFKTPARTSSPPPAGPRAGRLPPDGGPLAVPGRGPRRGDRLPQELGWRRWSSPAACSAASAASACSTSRR